VAVRRWDLARAAKAEKLSFWADIVGYFFIFLGGGRCARSMLRLRALPFRLAVGGVDRIDIVLLTPCLSFA
jgi:hypothetical protein